MDANGFSNVVYATTWGYGPLANIGGGEVWVTTNAATTLMSNKTGSINPKHYAISSVAIDTSVANGQTAYVGIMGFHTSHVWKTTNAGTGWTDWTGSGVTALPDAPVSALLVDTGLIYAGTDVGVFSSPTTGTGGVWTEVGPVAGSGAGFLPSAPVTAIQIFSSGTTKALRVSTYGRGIWEFSLTATPSFALSAAPASMSITPGGAAGTSTITVTPAGGFTGSVSLVASGLPSGVTASFNPTSTTTTSVLSLTASSSATAGTATVTITGTSGSLTATTTIALTVTGATTTTALTSSQNPANQGVAVTFTATVTTTGTHLPTGKVTFNDGTTALGTGTLNGSQKATFTTSTLTVGTHSITAVYGGDANNAGSTSAALTQTINPPTFTITTPPTPATALSGQSATSTFSVTPTSGTTTVPITFACNNLPDATVGCTFNPAQIAAGAAGGTAVPVTLTITTVGPNSGTVKPQHRRADNRSPWLPLTLPLAGIVMVGLAGRKVSKHSAIAGLCVSLALLGLLVACGGSNPPVAISVSPAGATVFASDTADGWPPQTATFTATVTHTSNTAVNWSVSPANGGSITSAGVYTAPTAAVGLPGSATITATSQADTTKTATAIVTITPTTVPGSYPLSVTATEGPTQNTTPNFTLTVQ